MELSSILVDGEQTGSRRRSPMNEASSSRGDRSKEKLEIYSETSTEPQEKDDEFRNSVSPNLLHRMQSRLRRSNEERRNLSQSVPVTWLSGSIVGISVKSVEPEIVSIGPLHRHRTKLLQFEEFKCLVLPMSNEDFIQMMLLDGCFLIELMCYHNRGKFFEAIDDPILAQPNLISVLARDVLKIENQLPFFVLESLFDKSGPSKERFMKLAMFYFCLVQQVSGNNGDEYDETYASTHSMQCVTELKLSGIKFKQRKDENFLDIKFKNRALLIPSITLNDMMSTVLTNCMALEQSRDYRINYISDYVSFLSCLISQPRDVSSLSSDGIISKFSHNDKYVADFFNNLGENTVYIRQSYLSNQIQNVEAYYNSYWATIKLFAASFLLVLATIQTVMSVLSYNRGLK
ncbi:hypothetical protein Patl1_19480 [Pistacia atlantica]|uniref:Uncharacterized protein n=1 Tax=Pistacia atlantica TaxID=434234 RepID=A0ACC1BXF0_9ROSI|nr:hypothetical protein Patl1_19480 [Pistacia atlantica]